MFSLSFCCDRWTSSRNSTSPPPSPSFSSYMPSLHDYLMDRSLSSAHQWESQQTMIMASGVDQGTNLGPRLWLWPTTVCCEWRCPRMRDWPRTPIMFSTLRSPHSRVEEYWRVASSPELRGTSVVGWQDTGLSKSDIVVLTKMIIFNI